MDLEELAFNEAVRRIEQQEATLQSLHARAATVVSASAVSTALLAGFYEAATAAGRDVPAFSRGAAVLALVLFIGTVLAGGVILWPKDWRFGRSGRAMIDNYASAVDGYWDMTDIYYDMVSHLEDDHAANDAALTFRFRFFQLALVMLAAEVVLWIGSLLG